MKHAALLVACALSCTSRAAADEYGAVATAARLARPIREEPASVTVIRREEIALNPTLTTDNLLRSLPSALTFRRSTSLVADPSSQGLNLRGVGPSGVARTLLLVDGVPANDPFSGSLYFRSLPRLGIERIEVVPSGSSALYGSAALAGVVQLVSRATTTSYEGEASYGSFHTVHGAVRASQDFGMVGAALEAELLRSDGYIVVAPEQRGPIDDPADSLHGTVNARVDGQAGSRVRLAANLRLFRERQNGGTRYTTAGVDFALLGLSGQVALQGGHELELSLFGRVQRFQHERARIAPERVSEALSARQNVPADDQGGSLLLRSRELSWGGRHRLLVGLDTRRVHGTSRERIYAAMVTPTSLRSRNAGGEQLSAGLFAQESYAPTRSVQLDAALRFDVWHNRDGTRELTRESGERERTRFAERTESAVSPRLGLLVRPHEVIALRASGYRAFRAPTLNELYRPFQVGTVLTAANAALGPELLTGFEGGLELTPFDTLVVRAVGFYNHLDRPITNVTLAQPLPDGAQRERRNLGSAVVRGAESAIELRIARRFTSVVGYTFARSEVREAGNMRELLGKELPQAPRHRASLLLAFDDPRLFSAALQLRVLGRQFEDDQNTLPMKPYPVIDVSASRLLFWRIALFVAVENLLNQSYLVGRAGVDTIGQPLFARVGLRVVEQPLSPEAPATRAAAPSLDRRAAR
jgi:iron complex outermembrane recepter protein